MKLRFSFWSIFLLFLAVVCFHGSGAEEVNVLQLHSEDGSDHDGDGHGHSHPSHTGMSDDVKTSDVVVFNLKDLKPGKTLPIYFEKQDPPPLLSKEEADSIPFTSSHLPSVLKLFSFSQGSLQAQAVEAALGYCERKPLKGEIKFCATNKESMLNSLQSYFGKNSHFRSLTTSYLSESTTLFQNYTILGKLEEMPAHPKMMACHSMPYPYLVFYCHFPGGENKVFRGSLQGENGDKVDGVFICHLDSTSWSRDNIAFRLLKIRHGDPVCHIFPPYNYVFVPSK